jgi:hypothetical protein
MKLLPNAVFSIFPLPPLIHPDTVTMHVSDDRNQHLVLACFVCVECSIFLDCFLVIRFFK